MIGFFKIPLSQMVGKIIMLDYLLINDLLCKFTLSFFRSLFSPLGTLSLSIKKVILSTLFGSLFIGKNISPGG
uniref:Uncharacterized protein n=1 Tax=Lepeophtheirus salmonis TaxID=72036 RepID=A0A0K2UM12_LEPSM